MTQPGSPRPVGGGWWNRRVVAWALYDFATTPYSALVSTVAYPTFFKEVIARGAPEGDFMWGLTSSLTMALVVITAPTLGVYADAVVGKRRLLMLFTAVMVVGTALLATGAPGRIVTGILFSIVAGYGYQGGQVFYNALLPEMADERHRGSVSGLGDGLGYLGAIFVMVLALPFYGRSLGGGTTAGVWPVFLAIAGFTIVFSLPAFLFVREGGVRNLPVAGHGLRTAWARQWRTLRHIRRYPVAFRFLLAFLVYTDAITTMSVFISIYARDTAKLSLSQILILFLVSNLTAALGSLGMGRLADRIGAKPTINICLVLWVFVIGLGIAARSFAVFMGVGILAGIGLGALTTVSRSLMTLLSPPERQAEFFGFYAVAGRASAVIGPPVFGAVSWLTGNQRISLAVLGGMIAVSFFLMQRVRPGPPSAPVGVDGGGGQLLR
jgi:MFS transporter, UMF1 family